MIKLTCNRGDIELEINGIAVTLMSELCIIVDIVCENMSKEFDNSESLKTQMIRDIANVLLERAKRDEEHRE